MTEAVFSSTSSVDGAPGYRERTGQSVEIIAELDLRDDPDKDDEVEPLYRIRFADGVETEAFADELDVASGAEVSGGG